MYYNTTTLVNFGGYLIIYIFPLFICFLNVWWIFKGSQDLKLVIVDMFEGIALFVCFELILRKVSAVGWCFVKRECELTVQVILLSFT